MNPSSTTPMSFSQPAKRARSRSPNLLSPNNPSHTSSPLNGGPSKLTLTPLLNSEPNIRQGRSCKTLSKLGIARMCRQGSGESLNRIQNDGGMFDSVEGEGNGFPSMKVDPISLPTSLPNSLPGHQGESIQESISVQLQNGITTPPPLPLHNERAKDQIIHRDEMFFSSHRGKIDIYHPSMMRRSGYVPGEWPLDSRGRLRKVGGKRKKGDGSGSNRREMGVKQDVEVEEKEKEEKSLGSTSSTPTRDKPVWRGDQRLPSDSKIKRIDEDQEEIHGWNGGLRYYLMGLWGLFVALVVIIISAVNEYSPPSTLSSSRSSFKRSSSVPNSIRSTPTGSPKQSTTPIQPLVIKTTIPSDTPIRTLSRHVTFPPAYPSLHPQIEKMRSLSAPGPSPQTLHLPPIDTRRVSEGDQSTSPTSVASHMPELTADEGSNSTSPRSSSPSSPVDDRKRVSHLGLAFSPIQLIKGTKRDSMDGFSPKTSPASSPLPSRRPSVLGPHPDTQLLRSIAGVIGTPRESTETNMTRVDSVPGKTADKQRINSGTASTLRTRFAGAFHRNATTKKQGEDVLSLHQALEGTSTLSPPSSNMPSRIPSYVEGTSTTTSAPPARFRGNSIFSLLKRRQSEDEPSRPSPSTPPTSPTPPRLLIKPRERRKSTGAYGMNISSPIGPALRPAQIEAMRASFELRREQSESALEIAESTVRVIDPNTRSLTPPISIKPAVNTRKLVRSTNESNRLRSNPYNNVPDWSTSVPGYERRRRRREVRELEENLVILNGWVRGDQASRKEKIKWEKSREKLFEQLSELRRKGMEGRELKEFEAREDTGSVEVV